MGKFLESEKINQIRFKTKSNAIAPAARIDGIYKGKSRPFCLPVEFADQNLFPSIRKPALEFFAKHDIKWHDGKNGKPSNHLCDSQVSCVNFLFPFVDKPQELAKLLRLAFPHIKQMLPVEDGYFVSFEWIGEKNYLGERTSYRSNRTRGANYTSADAITRFERDDGKIQIVLIEWKYTESYPRYFRRYSKSGTDRGKIYQHLFDANDCHIKKNLLPDYDALFYDPFYQMMRQQFLAHEMEKGNELEADIVSLLHIAPARNQDFGKVTSPKLASLGKTATDVWQNLVKPKGRFLSIHTETLYREFYSAKMDSWKIYMQERYPWLIEIPKLSANIAQTRPPDNEKPTSNWSEGIADVKEGHIKIWYKDEKHPSAIVTKNNEEGIVVQFFTDESTNPGAKEEIIRELNFYFNELNKQKPWRYAIYHCSTSSNMYSDVRWGYFPKGWQPR
jgi:hypothetical protein